MGTSLTIIAVCQVIMAVMIFLTAAALIVAILMFKKMVSSKIDELMDRVQPIVDQTKEIAQQAKETAEKVSEKVDSIMTKAESTAEKVTTRMDHVTAKVEESVSPQAASVAGYLAAALRAFQLFKDISSVRHPSGKHEDPESHI